MAKANYYCLVDTETAIDDTVADFSAIICNTKGEIQTECAILVKGVFGDTPLFHNEKSGELWKKANLERRMQSYTEMLNQGKRMIASVSAINNWIAKVIQAYNPSFTAYNVAFDIDKMKKTGITTEGFKDTFCLWHAANGCFADTKAYKQWCLDNHAFNAPTELGNMTYHTNGEIMANFLNGSDISHPHTAREDLEGELVILQSVLKVKKWRDKLKVYNWRDRQVKNHFSVK